MSDSYAKVLLCRPCAGIALDFFESFIGMCGLNLVHPDSLTVVTWTASGSDDGMSPAQVVSHIRSENRLAFQLWWAKHCDLFCAFTTGEQFLSFEFSLSGLSAENKLRVTSSLWELALSPPFAEVFAALVLDWEGNSAIVSWEDRLVTGLDPNEPLPNTLVLSTNLPAFQNLDRTQYLPIHLVQNAATIHWANSLVPISH